MNAAHSVDVIHAFAVLPDRFRRWVPGEPGANDHKYSIGTVGVCAGSTAYPGAGHLAVAAAVAASNGAVIGVRIPQAFATAPEVLHSSEIVPRPDAWVHGPGRGTDIASREELLQLFTLRAPLILDADALSLIASDPECTSTLIQRSDAGLQTILTPHEAEFARIRGTEGAQWAGRAERIRDVQLVAQELGTCVLLKGRETVIVDPGGEAVMVDVGSGWLATPGSGDVLSGLLGAFAAAAGEGSSLLEVAVAAVVTHARAARLAAETPYGCAPISASKLVESTQTALASILHGVALL